MGWRGSVSLKDRILASLPYLLAMVEGLIFGSFLILLVSTYVPIFALLLSPLFILLALYSFLNQALFGYGSFVIFLALFLLVVRNESIHHFIRFNTMQALLIGIAASLVSAFLNLTGLSQQLLAAGLDLPIPWAILFSTVFLGVMATSLFSVVQALRGHYAEIPVISEAAYLQVR